MPAVKPTRKSESKRATKSNNVSSSTRAGTVFPVGRLNGMMKRARLAERSSVTAGVFMAAVLEYIVGEVMESAGTNCERRKAVRIIPKDINLAVRTDPELAKMLCDATVAQGGMLAHIHPQLLQGKAKKDLEAQAE